MKQISNLNNTHNSYDIFFNLIDIFQQMKIFHCSICKHLFLFIIYVFWNNNVKVQPNLVLESFIWSVLKRDLKSLLHNFWKI